MPCATATPGGQRPMISSQPAPFIKNQGTIHRLYLDHLEITRDAVVDNAGQINEIYASPDVKLRLQDKNKEGMK